MCAKSVTSFSDLRSMPKLFGRAARKYPNQSSFLTRKKDSQEFVGPTFHKLFEEGQDLAAALIFQLRIEKGAHIGLISENCLEWMLANYAIQMAAAVTVPRGTDITGVEIEYIFNHAEIRTCFVETPETYKRIQNLGGKLKHLEHIIIMKQSPESDANANDRKTSDSRVWSLKKMLQEGKKKRNSGESAQSQSSEKNNMQQEIDQRIESLQGDDIFTLLYTSGTTGNPKGVMLTHSNMLKGQLEYSPFLFDSKRDTLLSILPIWHAFELVVEMLAIYCGTTTAYTNIRTIKEDLTIVRPTFMASAPRLWESIYNGLIKRVQAGSAVKRILFQGTVWSSGLFFSGLQSLRGQQMLLKERSSVQTMLDLASGIFKMLIVAFPFVILDFLVFSKVRKALGGRLKQTISGGGALPSYIDHFFNQLGIKVLEGYGLTETAPVVAVRTPAQRVIGTVGKPLRVCEIKILSLTDPKMIVYQSNTETKKKGIAGVVHVRGPFVMKGYYKAKEKTDKVLDSEGWLNTGDIGLMTVGDSLQIIGRVKDTIVLSNGENVEPVPIENTLLQSPYILQCMLVGQDQKNIGALIVIENEECKLKNRTGINGNQEIRTLIRQEINNRINKNSRFKDFERVTQFALLENEFTIGKELTSSFKVKRHVIQKKYKTIIDTICR